MLNKSKTWLLLIHQIPPKPNALRVKIWRRLQQVGAVAIKQSVYAMPDSEQSREDLSWTLKEIIDGGGDGSISEARFIEGLTDDQIIALFQKARAADYEKILQEANLLSANWPAGENVPFDPVVKNSVSVSKLGRRLEEVVAIDFFQAPERETTEIVLNKLANRLSSQPTVAVGEAENIGNLEGKTWVTRRNLFVDRLACGWLIRRFVDKSAAFKFVSDPQYHPEPGEIRFDMFGGEFTHEGNCCTFQVMIRRWQIQDRALAPLAEIVHDIDLKDNQYKNPETSGIYAMLTGLVAAFQEDDQRLVEGMRLFENMYAFFQSRKRE